MTLHTMHCQEPWFSLILNGSKPVEGRRNSKKWRNIREGDTLLFTNDEKSFHAAVQKIDHFASIESYLETVGLDKALPGVASLEEGIAIYRQWSTPDEVKQEGFLGIWISPIKES